MAGVLAQTARSSPLPLEARAEVAGFLELFNGVPATTRVLQEICSNPVNDQELLVHALAPDTRIVMSWLSQEAVRGRRMVLGVSVNWQQWTATSEPWSVDLQMLPDASGHVEEVWMAGRRADLSSRPAGVPGVGQADVESGRAWSVRAVPDATAQAAVPDEHRAVR